MSTSDVAPSAEPLPAAWSVDIALTARIHDRAGVRRGDEAWLDRAWTDPTTRVGPVAEGRFPVREDASVAWLSPGQAGDGLRIFLGTREGRAYFALLQDSAPDESWTALRKVGPLLSEVDAGLMVHAVALAEWHAAHRHCPRCGSLLAPEAAGHVLACTGCGRQQFPRTDPAVIMLVTDDEGRALLGRQPVWPDGRWSTLAGFVEPGESIEQAVRREVWEEAGVRVGDVDYFGSQPWPLPASLMLGFVGRAESTEIRVDDDEIEDARWFSREDVLAGARDGSLVLPGGISISRSLVEHWYGEPLPGHW